MLQPAMRSKRLAQRHLPVLPANGGAMPQLLGKPVHMAKQRRSAFGARPGPKRRQPEPYGIGPLGRALQVQLISGPPWYTTSVALQCSCCVCCCPDLTLALARPPMSNSIAMQPRKLTLHVQPGSISMHSTPLGQDKPLKQSVAMQAQVQDRSHVTEEDRAAAELLIGFRTASKRCGIACLKHATRHQRHGDHVSQAHAQAEDDIALLSCKQLCANMTSSACTEVLCLPACTPGSCGSLQLKRFCMPLWALGQCLHIRQLQQHAGKAVCMPITAPCQRLRIRQPADKALPH